MADPARPSPLRLLARALAREWREIGGLGRVALLGIGASVFVAVALGFSITAAAERHLLSAQTDLLQNAAAEVAGLPSPIEDPSPESWAAFDSEVRTRLLGGETLSVKLWLRDGSIAYSDDADLVGSTFSLSEPAVEAFAGDTLGIVVDTDDPAHEQHRHLGSVIEFFIPFGSPGSEPVAVFEIEQSVDGLEVTLGRITRNVWLSIATGLGALGVFLTALLFARIRALNRRRREAERLFGDLLAAQDEERRRVVGALHDDVGQPLYRLFYGLDGSIDRLEASHPVRPELERLREIVSDVDDTLRAELRQLHEGLSAEAGLEAALRDLAETTGRESGLDVRLSMDGPEELSAVRRTALYRAIREGVMNARRHSGASDIEVRVEGASGVVRAEVRDDGSGYEGEAGLGLTTTRERLEALGGSLSVGRRSDRGTLYVVTMPDDQSEVDG